VAEREVAVRDDDAVAAALDAGQQRTSRGVSGNKKRRSE